MHIVYFFLKKNLFIYTLFCLLNRMKFLPIFLSCTIYRYNELDQPVCRVCDVVLKSEFQWDAHQASRKHIEVI
jgi:hypothetical protein